MNATDHNSERGQAIIYLVLGLVVFLGFVALAIDGGMALSDRRHAQNLADASSLAGGAAAGFYLEDHRTSMCEPWSCANAAVAAARGDAVRAAIRRAKDEYNWTIDDNISDHNGVNTGCGADPNYIDVTVQISTTTPSNFMQLFSTDVLQNEVEAVTRVIPGGPVAFGNAVVALNPEACSDPGSQGLIVGGSGIVNIDNGDMFSNGCLRQNGDAVQVKVTGVDPDTGVPYKAMGHELKNIDPDNWDPDPVYTSKTIDPEDFKVTAPNCGDPSAHHITADDLTKSFPTTLDPGLWCISGDLKINQNSSSTDPVLVANGVTFYMENGHFWVNGSADISLTAPPPDTDPYPALPGILIYMPESNTNFITLNGTSGSIISGFIYAPQNYVTLTGTGGNTYEMTQVLGWDVEFTGDVDLNLHYEGCQAFIRPPKIELYK